MKGTLVIRSLGMFVFSRMCHNNSYCLKNNVLTTVQLKKENKTTQEIQIKMNFQKLILGKIQLSLIVATILGNLLVIIGISHSQKLR